MLAHSLYIIYSVSGPTTCIGQSTSPSLCCWPGIGSIHTAALVTYFQMVSFMYVHECALNPAGAPYFDYALLVCWDATIGTTADGAARLVDGAAQNEGRLEVSYKGAFGSVCEDNFGTSEAATVCHQLGFAGVSRLAPCCQFGQTSGETWLDDVDCRTGEVWLANCTHRGWGVEDCHHGQDVGVVCNGMLTILCIILCYYASDHLHVCSFLLYTMNQDHCLLILSVLHVIVLCIIYYATTVKTVHCGTM